MMNSSDFKFILWRISNMNLRKSFLICLSTLLAFTPVCSQAMNGQVEQNSTSEQCILCLGDYSNNDEQMNFGGAIELKCESNNKILPHKFHQVCLFDYLGQNNGCPLCKFPVPEAVKAALKSKFFDKENKCMVCFVGFETGFVECPNCKYRSHVGCLWDKYWGANREPCPNCGVDFPEYFKTDIMVAMRKYGVIDIHDVPEMKGKSDDEILYNLVERYLGWKVLKLEKYEEYWPMFHGALLHVGNRYADPHNPTEGQAFWIVERECIEDIEGVKPIVFKNEMLGNKFIETLYEGIYAVSNGQHTRDSFLESLRNRLDQKHKDEQEEYEALDNNYKICNIF